MKLILTRHTTTDWNLAGRIQGRTDIELAEQGRAEARRLAEALAGFSVNLIVSSDLRRAAETAEIVSARLGAPIKLDPRLRECSFGKIEGLTKEQAIERFGPAVKANWDDQYGDYDFRPFGGENRERVLRRHLEALKSLASQAVGAALLVGHGRGLHTLLSGLGEPPALKRGEYRIIEYRGVQG